MEPTIPTLSLNQTDLQNPLALGRLLFYSDILQTLPQTQSNDHDGFIPISLLKTLPAFQNQPTSTIYQGLFQCPKPYFTILRNLRNIDEKRQEEDEGDGVMIRSNYERSIDLGDWDLLKEFEGEGEGLLIAYDTDYESWLRILRRGCLEREAGRNVRFFDVEIDARRKNRRRNRNGDSGVGENEIWIYAWTGRGKEHGVRFYRGRNGVVVSPEDVGKGCWEFVVNKRTGEVLWERNEERERKKEREQRTMRALEEFLRSPFSI